MYKKRYRYPTGVDIGKNKPDTPILTKNIYYKNRVVSSNKKSQILIIGNSFIDTPMEKRKSYTSLLAKKILHLPQNYSVSAHGPATTIPLSLLKNRIKYLRGKKICILPLDVSRFYDYWIDINDIDSMLTYISNKKEIYSHKIMSNFLNITNKKGLFKRKRYYIYWKNFIHKNPDTAQFLFEKVKMLDIIAAFDVPKELQNRELVVFVKLAIATKRKWTISYKRSC